MAARFNIYINMIILQTGHLPAELKTPAAAETIHFRH